MGESRHNLHEPSQQSEDVKGKVKELIPLLERFKEDITGTTIDGDQAESRRRSVFSRYVRRSLTISTIVNGIPSALEDIEQRSRVLLEKGAATRFLDKGEDSAEVASLIERLREAITHYQVSENYLAVPSTTHTEGQISQQQAIYDQVTSLTVRAFRFVYPLR